jgi:hypothetical protein
VSPYEIWRPEFAKAIDPIYGIKHLDYLVLHTGTAKFWPGVRAAIVTQMSYFADSCIIEGLVAAGDMKEIVESLIPQAEAWGKEQGASFAVISSREGWQRVLEPHGYSVHQVMLGKPL